MDASRRVDADAAADLVVLAAGASSRMGEPKGLVAYRGRPWIEHQLDAAQSAGIRRVVVVLGRDRERYVQAVPSLGQRGRAIVAVNPDPDRGPFSSLQCGLHALGAEGTRAAFVLPVDVPAASPEVWHALTAALHADSSVDAVVPVVPLGSHDTDPRWGRGPIGQTWGGPTGQTWGGGHPIVLSSSFAARLLALPPDDRLDHVLRRPGVTVARVPVTDPRVRLNLNRPEDWGTLKKG